MTDSLANHITKSIRAYYRRRLILPLIFLGALFVVSFFYPILSQLAPTTLSESSNLETAYNHKKCFVNLHLDIAYFTGYREQIMGHTTGYYYYAMKGDDCVILLLSPDTSQQGLSTIENLDVHARIIKDSVAQKKLLSYLAEDLSWNNGTISKYISEYTLSEPAATGVIPRLFFYGYCFFFAYCVISIIVSLIAIINPVLSRPVRSLKSYGKPKKILKQAEEELATLPQLATEDMFITEHYFIETSGYGVAIVPISEMLWIYKYSTLHKILWHHFSISYTLYISTVNRKYIRCPKNIKSDIDGIIDYLSEANHDILVGFSEENRRKAAEIQGVPLFIKKISNFLGNHI